MTDTSPSDLHVRRYEPGDVDAIWDLHERALRDVGAYDEAFAHLDEDLRNVESEYLDAGGEFLVGEITDSDGEAAGGETDSGGETGDVETGSDGEVVAMGAVQPSSAVDHHETDENTGVVRRMRVDPDHQRRGFGSRILTALEGRAEALGFERLVLDTTPDQTAARGLYESFGYREARRESTPAGEMIFYEKSL